MVSISTIIILVAASIAIGPKELPKAARIFGRLTGRTVKFIGDLRLTLNQSRDSEVMRLKSDLEQVVNQFTQIQTEVKRGLTLRGGGGGGTTAAAAAAYETAVRHGQHTASAAPTAIGTAVAPRRTEEAVSTQNMARILASQSDATAAEELHSASFANAFASMHHSSRLSVSSDDDAMVAEEAAKSKEERKQFMRQLKEVQESSVEKHRNPYSWDEAEERWAQKQFRRHRGKPVDNPFASVPLGHQPLNDLYEDGSSSIHTETMGSGADILSKNILERHFATFHADLEKHETKKE